MFVKRLEEIKKNMPAAHKELVKYVEHALIALGRVEEEHRALVAANALAGIRPDGEEEKLFYEHMNLVKEMMVSVLEKTEEDIEHAGDKNWSKNYADGVEK